MIDHVAIRASSREASEPFYDTVLATLGIAKTHSDDRYAAWGRFALFQADEANPVTRRLHVGFGAPSRAHVDDFWRAGTEAGHRDDGAPGPRPEYTDDYYGGFLLDPDGNSAEAVYRDHERTVGQIDHLWIRVADVAAAKRLYETVAPHAGLRLVNDTPGRARFACERGSFSLVSGTPTEHLHLAFTGADDAAVDRFHRAATEAGHRDNGGPGERAVYHPGYYGAFVLDSDGNNVEVVNHNLR